MHRCVRSVAARFIPGARFSSTSAAVTPVEETSPAPVVEKKKWGKHTLQGAPTIKPAFNRKVHRMHRAKHMLQEEVLNSGDLTDAARLYDYKRTGEIAASLSNIAERIAFVSPYERPWTRAERTWRRDWHPALVAPRKAWAVPPVPTYFDVLSFYKYITKTHVEHASLDELYTGIRLPTATLKDLTTASLRAHLASTAFDSEADRISAILGSLVDDAILSIVHARPELAEQRVSYKSKNEAFWIRAGFSFLYQTKNGGGLKIWNNQKYTGDDRRKLGELAFVHRDELAVSVRSKTPMEDLLKGRKITDPFWDVKADKRISPETEVTDELTGEVIKETIENKALYSPRVFNMWPDEDPLWQCPGYFVDSAESHQHTQLVVKSLAGLNEQIKDHWRMRDEEAVKTAEECAIAQAVTTAFATLTATAHTQGFTQYNDITAPLSTQLVLSDGRNFYFAVARLNTIAINVELKNFPNHLHNELSIDGPFPLYDSIDEDGKFIYEGEEGLNDAVFDRLLQMIYKIK